MCEGAHASVVDQDRREVVGGDKNAAVLARLQKLEEAVFGKGDATPSSIKQTSESRYSTPVSRFAEGEEAEAAYSELEVIGTREDSLVSITAARKREILLLTSDFQAVWPIRGDSLSHWTYSASGPDTIMFPRALCGVVFRLGRCKDYLDATKG